MDQALLNAIVVLKALDLGFEVELQPDFKITLGEDDKGRLSVCHRMVKLTLSKDAEAKTEEVLASADLSLTHFIQLCGKLSEVSMSILKANVALNSLKREEANGRTRPEKVPPQGG